MILACVVIWSNLDGALDGCMNAPHWGCNAIVTAGPNGEQAGGGGQREGARQVATSASLSRNLLLARVVSNWGPWPAGQSLSTHPAPRHPGSTQLRSLRFRLRLVGVYQEDR